MDHQIFRVRATLAEPLQVAKVKDLAGEIVRARDTSTVLYLQFLRGDGSHSELIHYCTIACIVARRESKTNFGQGT